MAKILKSPLQCMFFGVMDIYGPMKRYSIRKKFYKGPDLGLGATSRWFILLGPKFKMYLFA